MAWERDTALKGLALLIASRSLGTVSKMQSNSPPAARKPTSLPRNHRRFWSKSDHTLTLPTHTERHVCVHTWNVWLQCVSTCLIELAVKQEKNRNAENVCECGRTCRTRYLLVVSSWRDTHTHTIETIYTHPVFTAHSLTGAHMQNTYANAQIIYAQEERNKQSPSSTLQHARVLALWNISSHVQQYAPDNKFKVQF